MKKLMLSILLSVGFVMPTGSFATNCSVFVTQSKSEADFSVFITSKQSEEKQAGLISDCRRVYNAGVADLKIFLVKDIKEAKIIIARSNFPR